MNESFILLFSGSIIEVQRIKSLLEEHKIFPIIKDETESARLAGFGVTTMMQQIWVAKSKHETSKTLIQP
jgi:hypothetical protein